MLLANLIRMNWKLKKELKRVNAENSKLILELATKENVMKYNFNETLSLRESNKQKNLAIEKLTAERDGLLMQHETWEQMFGGKDGIID